MALRLGIIGCGDIAGYAALFVRIISGLQITACCDSAMTTSQAFSRKHRISNSYDNYHALIADPAVDALYIAVPHHLHFPILAAAIEARKPALCEKPITRTLAEGVEITDRAEAAGVKVGVNYQYRYDSAGYALARVCQSGQLGRLLYAQAHLPWHRTASYFPQGSWRSTIATAGGGTLLTQGSHLLDLALWAMGCAPVAAVGMTARRVFQNVEVEDLANGILELEGGAQLSITSSMIAQPEQALRLEIFGEFGSALYTDRPWPRLITKVTRRESALPTNLPPLPLGLHALHRSLIAFRDWLLHDRPYLIPALAALPALVAVDGIYRSAELGEKVGVV